MSDMEIYLAIVFALWLWTVFSWFQSIRRIERYLMFAADRRKPVGLGDRLFYIVPYADAVRRVEDE